VLLRAADFAMPNIPDAALQHHYRKVANCGFLRRNCNEAITVNEDGSAEIKVRCAPDRRAVGRLRVVHLDASAGVRSLKNKTSLNENRRPLARKAT
jgi:hypothetical protein